MPENAFGETALREALYDGELSQIDIDRLIGLWSKGSSRRGCRRESIMETVVILALVSSLAIVAGCMVVLAWGSPQRGRY